MPHHGGSGRKEIKAGDMALVIVLGADVRSVSGGTRNNRRGTWGAKKTWVVGWGDDLPGKGGEQGDL